MQRPTNLPSPILIIGQVWPCKEKDEKTGLTLLYTQTTKSFAPHASDTHRGIGGIDGAGRLIGLAHNVLLLDIADGDVSDAQLKELGITQEREDAIMVVAIRQNGYMAWFQLGDDVLLYHSDTLTGLFDTVSRMHRVHAAALLWRRLHGPIAGDDTYEVWKAALIAVLDWVRSHPLSPTAPIISLEQSLKRA